MPFSCRGTCYCATKRKPRPARLSALRTRGSSPSWPASSEFSADAFHERAKGANVLLANEREARALTGLELRDAAAALAARYELVVVTAGAAGAVAVSRGEVVVARPGEPVARRRSGAGDAFAGVLLVSLAAGADLQEALDQACEAGGRALQL